MNYKALMLDVDGTLIPYDYDAMPSQKVVQAIKKAKEKVKISLVTGRAYGYVKKLLDLFEIHEGFAAVNNGSTVVNVASEELVYDQQIDKVEAKEIVKILQEERVIFYIKQDFRVSVSSSGIRPFEKGDILEKAYMFHADETYTSEKVDEIFKKLSHFPDLVLHKTKHKTPNKYGININHAKATKLHGIEIIMQKQGVKKEEIIGVGDSFNDFPLLMASGFKVAMGNAIPDLKEIADYVAPTVTEDGVADVIEKFILSA
jgi:Cof subfamily protein (haloacid dehalogenase superfamily)